MSRKFAFLFASLLAITLSTSTAKALELKSSMASIQSIGQTFDFDFTGDPSLGGVTSSSKLTGVSVAWEFHPAGGATGSAKLIADLFVPAVGGEDTGIGFNTNLNLGGAPGSGYSANLSTSELVFGSSVVSELLGGTPGRLSGALSVLNTNIPALNSFFDGDPTGRISATMFLRFANGGPGGSGGEVPEPASLMVWGLVGAGGWFARKRLLQKRA